MHNFKQDEFYDWLYWNFFDGPLCVIVEGQQMTIGVQQDENGHSS